MVDTGEGRGKVRINNIRLEAISDRVPQVFDEAGQICVAGAAGKKAVLVRGDHRGDVTQQLITRDTL